MSELPASSLVLSLAWFAIVNAAAGLAAWGLGSRVLGSDRPRTGLLLAIRLMPAAASLVFVGFMFLPSHLRLEPANAREAFGFVIVSCAVAGSLLLLRAAIRAIGVARAARALRACERLTGADARLPEGGFYEIEGVNGVSLAGLLRTRVVVGAAVVRELSRLELDVAIAHELAHRRAFDNVKRFAMFCAPDVFGMTPVARALEREWSAAAETVADDRAVDGDSRRALHLASALVKVAQLGTRAPQGLSSPAWSTLTDPPLLEARVRRLVAGAQPPAGRVSLGGALAAACAVSFVAIAVGAAMAGSIHRITEALVRSLP